MKAAEVPESQRTFGAFLSMLTVHMDASKAEPQAWAGPGGGGAAQGGGVVPQAPLAPLAWIAPTARRPGGAIPPPFS